MGRGAEAPGFEITHLRGTAPAVPHSDLRKNISGALRDRELAAPDGRTRRPAIQGTDMTRFPLTEAQSGLWYFQKMEPENPILNTGQFLEIVGPLDVDVFRAAFDRMVEETEALTLRFAEEAGGPVQYLDPAMRPTLGYADLRSEATPEAAAIAAMRRDTDTPLDLTRDPVAAFTLFRLSDERYFWYERVHHLAIDGYGWVLITNRVAELYSAAINGTNPAPAFPPFEQAVSENAEYLSSERRAADRAYWHDYLANLPEPGSMSAGRPVSGHSFRRHSRFLRGPILDKLRAVAQTAKVTWPDVLTALVSAYCQRFTGTSEVVVGVPHMGRLGSKAARVPCTLMNVLPLRVKIDDRQPMPEFLGAVAKDLIKARRHGRYRSEQMRRDFGLIGGARRLFGAMVNVQPFDVAPKMAGLDVTLHILGAGAVDDITFTFRGDANHELLFETDTNPNLYSEEATRAHGERLEEFLLHALDAATLSEVATASAAEAQRFLFDLNTTEHPVRDVTLTQLIVEGMRWAPDAPALRFEGETMSYRELDARTAALAEKLKEMGAGTDKIIAVALPRSFELVIALVATLRAGAAYLPLDTEHPRDRIARIMQSAKPICVLATAETSELFEGDPVLLTCDWPKIPSGADLAMPAPGDMAYVIYTSGSTGEPKGVVIEHRAIVNRLEWMRTHYGFGSHDRILQKTPATFDVSVWEFFLPLMCGAALVVAAPGAHRDPAAIAKLIRDEAITTLHFVPSMLSAFLAWPGVAGLKVARVFCSGEELTADHRDRFHKAIDGELHNLYGPTEAAVDVSYWPASKDDRSMPVPIGLPVWNTRLYVLDANMKPVPADVVGDLWLGGVQLARGYLGRPDLTEDRFLPDPFRPGERIYRTGDVARFRQDGAVVFLGRSDHQVKIRGLRIELGEIEAAIMSSGLARQTGVIAREDRPGDKRIVAYIVPTETYSEDAMQRHLAATVPDYMIPAAFVTLDELPVTSNGKLNRAALPAPSFADTGVRQATGPTETLLARLFAEVLGLPEPASADADFFALGGDSLLAVNLTLRIQEAFGRDPGLGAIFEHPTLSSLAALLDADAQSDDGLGNLIRLSNETPDKTPLFVIHPAGGISWCYRGLARAIGRPVYGLQSPALDPAKSLPESLDALAASYVEAIRAVQAEGPYNLLGWSVGGIIAHAMATKLREAGDKVDLLALLDAYPAECWRAEPEPDEKAALRALLAIAGYDPEGYPELETREDILTFLREGDSPIGNLPAAALDGVVRSVLDTNRLVRGHYHGRFDGVLTHIRAGNDHQGTNLVSELWNEHAAALRVIEVPFKHSQLTSPEATAMIVPALKNLLETERR